MAELRSSDGTRCCLLQPEHLVGRGSQCALRLEGEYVSAQHALLRWNGSRWCLLDRGSRNGTFLNGERLQPGLARELWDGALLAFGHSQEQWVLADASEPRGMVVSVQTGLAIPESGGVIGVPSAEQPECALYRVGPNSWMLEHPQRGTVTVRDGALFDASAQTWRCSFPEVLTSTAAADVVSSAPPVLDLCVTRDEEFVEAALRFSDRTLALGARAHNYLLLTLARARRQDANAGLPPSECGWVSKDELARQFRMTPQQIDGEVFRIRRHFGQHAPAEAATVIERRPRTTQLRLGLAEVIVRTR